MNLPKNSPAKANILIVDDKPDNLRLLSTILIEKGYKVRSVISGQMAIIACNASPPDLILLDINMPNMNGYQVCEIIKSQKLTRDIPVIFISALDGVLDKVEAFAIGGADYITKPFEVEEVLARVQNQLTIRMLQQQLQTQNLLLQQEIKERKLAENALQIANQELEKLVSLDGLTQVANRRRFDEYLNMQWQRLMVEKNPLSLILCDIDYFKHYNDTYGHLAGDDCLRQVARTISNNIYLPPALIARYGGEEFAVILPDISPEEASFFSDNIRQKIEKLKIPHQKSLASEYVTLSAGVAAIIPSAKFSSDYLISVADKALYEAKAQGRNRSICKNFISIVDVPQT